MTGSLGGGQDLTNTRSPNLRDVVDADGTPHGPFMHDGSKATLLDVINHYNAIPAVAPGLDRRLVGPPPRPGGPPQQAQRLNLSEIEKESLVSFLGTLTGSSVYKDEKGPRPSIRVMISPSSFFRQWSRLQLNSREKGVKSFSGPEEFRV